MATPRKGGLSARISSLRGWQADAAALAGGMMSAAALPPFFAIPVLLLSIPGLLWLVCGARGPAMAFRCGWWFGFGLNLVGLYWITEAILFEAERFWWLVPLAVPALAAVMALFVGVPATIAWYARPGWPQAVVLAGSWVLADLARQFIATGFPWNPMGSVWELPGRLGDIMIQVASLVGVHGMTLMTLLLAAGLTLGWAGRAACACLLAVWIGYGVLRVATPLPNPPDLRVLLVQGNVAQGQKWDRALMVEIFQRYLKLTREAVASVGEHPAVVVWPETASPALLETDAAARAAIAAAAAGHPALIGAIRFDEADRPRNSLFALDPSGQVNGIYDKWHLVPFGEYQPDWLPIGIQVVPGGGFARGPGPRTLDPTGVPPVGVLICYEAIFPSQVVDRVHRPDWLVNVTNDAWFGNSTGPRQHLAAARMRAVEEGLPLLRAANTGISAAFDARGHELARLGLGRTGYLSVALPAALPPTLYAQWGLLLPGCAALLAMGVGMARGVWSKQARSTGKNLKSNSTLPFIDGIA